ncbi:hypothetical protein Vretimale_13804 [Volvox reticuliferus]|nr:hypothetical protein Vretifemale_14563 [Volvox reticuliferus]GIM10022.1 hypothetical protein Vretimale_13804 [Volvox reticuliferus]
MCALGPDIHALQAACSVFLETCRCPLCALPWRKASTFPCGHTFCYDCAIATLEGPGISQSECPTCKGKYWKRDLRPNPQMMAVVEHTQKLLSIAELHAVGAASNGSEGGQAATRCSPNHDVRHKVSGGLLDGGILGGGPNCTEQERACTAAVAPAAVVRQVWQFGAKQGDGAGSKSPVLAAGRPNTSAAASLPQAADDAAANWAPEQARRLASAMRPAGQMIGDSAGTVSALQAAIQSCSPQALHVHGPIMPDAEGEEPIMVDGHARGNGPRCLSVGNDHAHRNQLFADAEQPPQPAILITATTHETVGVRACPPSVLQPLAPAEADPGGPLLPDTVAEEEQRCSRVISAGSGAAPAGSRYGLNALVSAPNVFYPARDVEVVSATPSVQGVGFAGDIGSRPLGPIPAATATPHEEFLARWRSQVGGGCATMPSNSKAAAGTGTGTGGGRLLPGSVVSIRLDIPSVNNAYLDFHGLLEQTTNWTARQMASPRRGPEHLAQECSRKDGDEGCRNPEEFEELTWWFRRVAELADPTDQEREALEFELSHVSILLEELVAMMAELDARGGCAVPAVADEGPMADRISVGRGACATRQGDIAVLEVVGGLLSEARQGDGDVGLRCGDGMRNIQLDNEPIVHLDDRITGDNIPVPFEPDDLGAEKLRARAFSVSQPPQQRAACCLAEGASSFSAGTLAPAHAACARNGARPQVPIHQAAAVEREGAVMRPRHDGVDSAIQRQAICGHRTANRHGDSEDPDPHQRGDSGDQQQPFYGSGSGGSCHPVVECAQEAAAANDTENDNDEPAGRGGRFKRARTELSNPGNAKPRTSPPSLRLPDCEVPHAVPASQQRQQQHVREAQVLSTLRPAAPVPRINQGGGAGRLSTGGGGSDAVEMCLATVCAADAMARPGAPVGVDVRQEPAIVPSLLAPPSPSPELQLRQGQGPEQGLENDGWLGAEANVHRLHDRTPAKRYRSEPPNLPLEPLSLNLQQLQQQGEEVKKVQGSLRQTRRAKARERGSAAAAIPVTLPGSGLELSAPGPAARRAKPVYVVTSGVGQEGRARLKELTRRVRGVELLSEVQP